MHLIQITLAISLAAAGVAQSTWPPSATLGNDLEGRQPVKGCKEKTDGDFTNRWRDVIQSEWVRSDSQLSQVVQALCSTSAELGSCTDDSVFKTCKYEAETQEYKVEYKASAADGNLVSCLEAAAWMIQECSDKPSARIEGLITTNFNGPGSDQFISYELIITPNLPPVECDSTPLGAHNAGDILLVKNSLCNEGACQQSEEDTACYREVAQSDQKVLGHRHNRGTNKDFQHCHEILGQIITECINKGFTGGKWVLDGTMKADNQEYYELGFRQLDPYQVDT